MRRAKDRRGNPIEVSDHDHAELTRLASCLREIDERERRGADHSEATIGAVVRHFPESLPQ